MTLKQGQGLGLKKKVIQKLHYWQQERSGEVKIVICILGNGFMEESYVRSQNTHCGVYFKSFQGRILIREINPVHH